MFYGWLGFALASREKLREGHQYLVKALKLGEEVEDHRVIGYACAWLAATCTDLGLLDEAIVFGKRARKISRVLKSDQVLIRLSIHGISSAYYWRGDSKKLHEFGEMLLDYGQRQSYVRLTAQGTLGVALGYFLAGDFPSAIECFQRAIKISVDPIWSCETKCLLGLCYIFNDQLQEAENTLEEVIRYSENVGAELWGTSAQGLLGIISLAKGNLSQGLKITEDTVRVFLENESRCRYATGQYLLGKVYAQIAQGAGPRSLSFLAKNIWFLVKNVLFARKKAEHHFSKAIEVAREIGAKGVLGQAYLDLGLLHKTKGKKDKARECICEAVNLFEQCEAETHLRRAKEALKNVG